MFTCWTSALVCDQCCCTVHGAETLLTLPKLWPLVPGYPHPHRMSVLTLFPLVGLQPPVPDVSLRRHLPHPFQVLKLHSKPSISLDTLFSLFGLMTPSCDAPANGGVALFTCFSQHSMLGCHTCRHSLNPLGRHSSGCILPLHGPPPHHTWALIACPGLCTDCQIISQSPIHVDTLLTLLVLWYLIPGHLLGRLLYLSCPFEAPSSMFSSLSLGSKSHSRSLWVTWLQQRHLPCSIPSNGFKLLFFTKGRGTY